MSRINGYPTASTLDGSEPFALEQGGLTRTGAVSQIGTYVLGKLGITAFQATGGTASRTLPARAGDVANVLEFGAGVGGDDALAIRNAIASGKKRIFVPPGTYTFKSTVATYGSATDPSCIEIRGLSDVWIDAYGATFQIDNSISSPTPVCTLSFTANAKHCGVLGATLVGNANGLTGSQENVAINFDSVTNITVRDVKITGTHLAAFTGVFVFDSLVDNVQCFNNALGMDLAHTENLTVRGCRFQANPGNPVTGINHHYDTPTLSDNIVTSEAGLGRVLRGGISNRLRMVDCTFDGFQNSIAIEDMQGALISRCMMRGIGTSGASGTAGVLLYIGTTALANSLSHTDTTIEDCEITGAGSSGTPSAGGVLLGTNVTKITLRNNRIFDNLGYGVSLVGPSGLANLTDIGSDYATRGGATAQTGSYHPTLGPLFARFNLGGAPATVTGSRGANAALASLISALASAGTIIDSTSA